MNRERRPSRHKHLRSPGADRSLDGPFGCASPRESSKTGGHSPFVNKHQLAAGSLRGDVVPTKWPAEIIQIRYFYFNIFFLRVEGGGACKCQIGKNEP